MLYMTTTRIIRQDIKVRVLSGDPLPPPVVPLTTCQLICRIGLTHPATVGIIRNRIRQRGFWRGVFCRPE